MFWLGNLRTQLGSNPSTAQQHPTPPSLLRRNTFETRREAFDSAFDHILEGHTDPDLETFLSWPLATFHGQMVAALRFYAFMSYVHFALFMACPRIVTATWPLSAFLLRAKTFLVSKRLFHPKFGQTHLDLCKQLQSLKPLISLQVCCMRAPATSCREHAGARNTHHAFSHAASKLKFQL